MIRMRIRYSRSGQAAGLSFRDWSVVLHEALSRSDTPLARPEEKGRPRLTLGPPLGDGHTSRAEYLDIELDALISATELAVRLAPYWPTDSSILWLRRIPEASRHLRASFAAYWYTIRGEFSRDAAARFRQAESWPLLQQRKGRERTLDLKKSVPWLEVQPGEIIVKIRVRAEGMPKPEEIVQSVFQLGQDANSGFSIERTACEFLPIPYPRTQIMEWE